MLLTPQRLVGENANPPGDQRSRRPCALASVWVSLLPCEICLHSRPTCQLIQVVALPGFEGSGDVYQVMSSGEFNQALNNY